MPMNKLSRITSNSDGIVSNPSHISFLMSGVIIHSKFKACKKSKPEGVVFINI